MAPPRPRSAARGVRLTRVTPFDRLGRFVVRRAWWVVGAWAVAPARRAPVRAAGAGRAARRRLHPRRPRVGAGEGAPRGRSSASPPSALVIVFHSPTRSRPGTPAFEAAAAPAMRDVADAPARRPRPVAPARAAPGLGRRPHRLRHRLPRPAARRLARRPADPARAARTRRPGSTVELAGGPAFYGDVQAVSRGGPAAERGHLAAARGARAAARVRLARRGRRAARRRRRGGARRARRRSSSSRRSCR